LLNRIFWNGLLLISFLALSSCSTVAPPPAANLQLSWSDRQAILKRLNSWQIKGKIAVRTSQDSGSATIDWLENKGRYSVSLTGPLGSGAMKLDGSPGHASIQLANGEKHSSDSPEKLLSEGWGFHLPVSYLKYWIRGLPVPGIGAATQFDSVHRLSSLKQGSWRIRFLSYTASAGIELPSRISITSPELSSKIIIYHWETNPY